MSYCQRPRVTLSPSVASRNRPEHALGQSKDYEFDRLTMEKRWAQGLSDAEETLIAAPWLEPMSPEVGARTFDLRTTIPTGDAPKNSGNEAGG